MPEAVNSFIALCIIIHIQGLSDLLLPVSLGLNSTCLVLVALLPCPLNIVLSLYLLDPPPSSPVLPISQNN